MKKYKNKTVSIIGLSERTGLAVAEKMVEFGANVIVSDIKIANQLKPQLAILEKYDNIIYDLGGHSNILLESDMIVVSPGVPSDIDIILKARKQGIEVISEIELAYRLTDANIIGITGTNGKTTVTSLIGHILQENLKCKVRVGGNIGAPMIDEISGLKKDDWLVIELSSFQLENIVYFKPDIALFLNFSPDHLDRHKTVDKYWDAKVKIFSNQSKDDISILNMDDDYISNYSKDIKSQIFEISMSKDIKNGVFYDHNYIYEIIEGNKKKVISTNDIPLIGTHNILNTAFAIMVSRLLSINYDNILKSVKSYKAFSHRLEIIADSDYTIIDDSKATNPHAAINALLSIKLPIILIAGGQYRDANFSDFAYTIKERVKKVILLGETKDLIKKELDKLNYKNYKLTDSMEKAVQKCFEDAKIGDKILLSPGCPSWDMYESYKKRGEDFQKHVKKILNSKRVGDQNE